MFLFGRKKRRRSSGGGEQPWHSADRLNDSVVDGNLERIVGQINGVLGENDDFTIRRFQVFGRFPAAMLFYPNMIDMTSVNSEILKPLMYGPPHAEQLPEEGKELWDFLLEATLYHSDVRSETLVAKVVSDVLRGQTAVVIEGVEKALLFGTRTIDKRSIDQPATEQVIRGPREGFIELLSTNISLIRYRLQTPDLRVKTMEIGRRTQSKVAICYMHGITNPELVKEVTRRLDLIDVDAILDSGYLEQFIEDNQLSPFPQVQYTERPSRPARWSARPRSAAAACTRAPSRSSRAGACRRRSRGDSSRGSAPATAPARGRAARARADGRRRGQAPDVL